MGLVAGQPRDKQLELVQRCPINMKSMLTLCLLILGQTLTAVAVDNDQDPEKLGIVSELLDNDQDPEKLGIVSELLEKSDFDPLWGKAEKEPEEFKKKLLSWIDDVVKSKQQEVDGEPEANKRSGTTTTASSTSPLPTTTAAIDTPTRPTTSAAPTPPPTVTPIPTSIPTTSSTTPPPTPTIITTTTEPLTTTTKTPTTTTPLTTTTQKAVKQEDTSIWPDVSLFKIGLFTFAAVIVIVDFLIINEFWDFVFSFFEPETPAQTKRFYRYSLPQRRSDNFQPQYYPYHHYGQYYRSVDGAAPIVSSISSGHEKYNN